MDWWCLGLLMHEMISARHPFHGPSHYDTLRNMVTKPPNLDQRLSTAAAVVVKGLLAKNPMVRLCCRPENKERGGICEMKALPFFAGVDWDALYARKIKMPYEPKLAGDSDISSFEATFTKERPVDSVVNVDGSHTSPLKDKKKGATSLLLLLLPFASLMKCLFVNRHEHIWNIYRWWRKCQKGRQEVESSRAV